MNYQYKDWVRDIQDTKGYYEDPDKLEFELVHLWRSVKSNWHEKFKKDNPKLYEELAYYFEG